MAEVFALAGVYRRLVGARIRGQLQYRLSFGLYLVGQLFAAGMDLLTILVIFDRIPALAGWSIEEVLFLYGTSQVGFTAADLFASQVDRCPLYIRTGQLDQLLVRPLGPLFQLSTGEFELRRAGKLIQAVAVMAIAAAVLPVPWTVGRMIVTASMIVGSFVLFGALWVIASSIAFWTIETQEVANSFTYGGGFLSQYPFDVFAGWLRRILLVIPLSFVSYLPAAWVLERDDIYGFPTWARLASPAAALAAVAVARAVWRVGIRHYRSTGS